MKSDQKIKKSVVELQKIKDLIQKEYLFDKETYKQHNGIISLEKKSATGLCRYPISLNRSYYNSINQFVIEFSNNSETDEEDEKEDQFEYGRSVEFFTLDLNGKCKFLNINGIVSFATNRTLVISIPSQDGFYQLENIYNLGVQLSFDETSYKAMFDALDKVISVSDGRLYDLREILIGTMNPEFFAFSPIRFPWLNKSQEEAVNKILRAKDVAIVHGPPGTGKTTTLVESIYETLRRECQVLVCAQSNMAVDWISEQLADRGINVLRVGNPSRVNDKMLSFTYERKFEGHPKYSALWAMRKTIRELYKSNKEKARSLKERAEALEYEIRENIFQEARVVACTLVGASNKILLGRNFQTLFIDEAAQALEPACWIAIAKSHRVIFAGDHKQLPPTIKCYEAEKAGLGYTLMEKLAKQKPNIVSLLTLQYRMNAQIMEFSSEWFYGGMLKAAEEVKYRGILDFDNPIEWINTEEIDTKETFIARTAGRINKAEAHFVIENLVNYIDKISIHRLTEEKINFGIISPYKAQVFYLRHLLKQNKYLKPIRKFITINTVDGFQGQERDVIILSLVRSNDKGEIGFLNELRRMNVAITRAKMKLIIIGDVTTLTQHPFYKKLYEMIDEE